MADRKYGSNVLTAVTGIALLVFTPKATELLRCLRNVATGQFTTPTEPSLGTNEMIKNCNRYCLCTIYGTQLSRSGLGMLVHGALGNM
jgi:hypothetical protein